MRLEGSQATVMRVMEKVHQKERWGERRKWGVEHQANEVPGALKLGESLAPPSRTRSTRDPQGSCTQEKELEGLNIPAIQ